jgi:hypothetical protein
VGASAWRTAGSTIRRTVARPSNASAFVPEQGPRRTTPAHTPRRGRKPILQRFGPGRSTETALLAAFAPDDERPVDLSAHEVDVVDVEPTELAHPTPLP